MNDLIKLVTQVLALIVGAPRWVKALVVTILVLAAAEFGQDGFLGDPIFWVSARFVPWPQLFAPAHTVATTYNISRPEDQSFKPLNFGAACAVGAKVRIEVERSGNGWIAVAGWNLKQGLYPIMHSGFVVIRAEKGTIYPFVIDITSSGGHEYLVPVGGGKPFDARRVFDEVSSQLSRSTVNSKGGMPEFPTIGIRRLEFGTLGACVS
jgi:hypothetical protein